ncbi:DNA-binding transcriptional regulator, AcrR family [Paracoccus isoporae]|uniref:DNA-binding transcriptional regulator, AcrR family n=1 Tax=Paracoccus isoporae TaxID=591205 RepID=A0A1G6XUC8_9RHOB|nr:TetR/AcrR family transcriptional regulator [Paracoccus isoporae]SDD81007.1 DNA-binding transcriptional regulator, AcrR family [Paracoccus isoporae]
MRDENRKKRHETIAAAAYALLAEHGYGGTSMLRVAKTASASNETLYRWYGDKDGLFAQMIEDNAAEIRDMLTAALSGSDAPEATLRAAAPVLLRMLVGDRAVLLNRAAAADATGRLGAAISAGGRGQVMPLLDRVMARLCADAPGEAERMTGWLLALLIGDWQIRRVIGEMARPGEAEIAARSAAAVDGVLRLIGDLPGGKAPG